MKKYAQRRSSGVQSSDNAVYVPVACAAELALAPDETLLAFLSVVAIVTVRLSKIPIHIFHVYQKIKQRCQ